jgi:N-acyl-D-amino-acid deacylase
MLLITGCGQKQQFDLVIRHARIYDGTGGQPFVADIGIYSDTIAFVGDLSGANGKTEVDAHGLSLSPGFIDTHSHHAGDPFRHRDFLAAVSQGVTTIVIGQDGGSNFPLSRFYRELTDTPVAVNIASYSGHNTLRDSVLGKDFKRKATPAEISRMKSLLLEDMQAGALGLSTGLEYDPGIYSGQDEVLELAKATAPFGGRYISHIRSEDRYFWKAVNEVLDIGQQAKIPVQISHIKLAMHNLWGKADSLLAILDSARKHGIDVTSDIYPYDYWHSTIRVLFPKRNFGDEREAEMVLREITLPGDIILAAYEIQPGYEGKTLAEIARVEHKSPARMLVELIARIEDWEKRNNRSCRESIMARSMNEEDIRKLMAWPGANICSDGSSSGGHPRGFGAFTRVLGHYVREQGTMPLEQAIHKMTELPAQHMGIQKRGLIRPGFYADLVLFDPQAVLDRATIQEPHRLSAGIEKVWVNGNMVYVDQKTTGLFPGSIIRRK